MIQIIIIIMIGILFVQIYHRRRTIPAVVRETIITFLQNTGIRESWRIIDLDMYNQELFFFKVRIEKNIVLSFCMLTKKRILMLCHYDKNALKYKHTLDQNQILQY